MPIPAAICCFDLRRLCFKGHGRITVFIRTEGERHKELRTARPRALHRKAVLGRFGLQAEVRIEALEILLRSDRKIRRARLRVAERDMLDQPKLFGREQVQRAEEILRDVADPAAAFQLIKSDTFAAVRFAFSLCESIRECIIGNFLTGSRRFADHLHLQHTHAARRIGQQIAVVEDF